MTTMPKPRRTAFKLPRRVLIAPDKFKGTLTADAAARAIERGLRRAWPGVKTTRLALTDGGEGFVDFMVKQTGGRFHFARTTDAAGRPCRAKWGVLGDGRTAVIGLTEASSLTQLPARLRHPEKTTNAGTARLMTRAIDAGCRKMIVGLGGSATTEGGISLAVALGFRFEDKAGCEIALTGGGLAKLARIVPPAKMPRVKFLVATDVDHPLYGPLGAALQFAPQKGADAAMVRRLDANLRLLARIVKRDLGRDAAHQPGAGSAGGCGYGMMAFFRAKQESGFQIVRKAVRLDALIREHDLVVTGEGCLDQTSLRGKAPAQLGLLARQWKRPAWALCGRIDLPIARTPFHRIAALSMNNTSGPAPEKLTPTQHAKRLEQLAFDNATALALPEKIAALKTS